MRIIRKVFYSSMVSGILFSACSKTTSSSSSSAPATTVSDSKIAPDGFTYATSKTIQITVNALTNNNKPLPQVPVNMYSCDAGAVGQLLYKGFTNASGSFTISIQVPNTTDTLIVDPAYIGVVRLAKVLLKGNQANCTFGGDAGYSGDIVGTLQTGSNLSFRPVQNTIVIKEAGYTKTTKVKFVPMGTTDSQGRPDYLEPTGDIISADMLASINVSLPESKNVALLHPQYLSSGATSDIVITEKSDVWLTFIYEGAGYRNTMGYYQYPTGMPPARMDDIDTIHFIFPNASLVGSGGGMHSGDKVKIGTFEPGTTIGLVLFADGWNGTSVNYYANGAYFSNSNLNPESNPDLKRHTVMLQYQNTYMIGFEDLNRENGSCDNDFNDVMVYASSNPITAISNAGVQTADVPADLDGDGVLNTNDAFPNDPTRAYVNYFPSAKTYGTLAYEDQWPNKGDYDLNDLVVNYRYKMISNAQNKIVEFYADYVPVAAGATLFNGFGVEFPFSASLVKNVTGQNLQTNYIKQNPNGTEAWQTNAVIIPFDNHANLYKNAGSASMLNTDMSKPRIAGDTAHIYVQFNAPITTMEFGNAPFNPFAIKNHNRGYEVHLPGMHPTNLADKAQLGTFQDATNIGSNVYYLTKDNHPWALSFVGLFSYPGEGVNISDAYLYFLDWANSGGLLYPDWYSNTDPGYRNDAKIYHK
ncbi:MAG: LruC domain-containing protein [Bacteroidota bacterium]|nr:LruC domain-containing protein [Bacteroidota bacterium]